MNEIIHDNVISVILIKFRINANFKLWQSFSVLNFGFGKVSDFFQNIDPCLKPLGTIIHPNSQFYYYPSESFNFHYFNVKHPVDVKKNYWRKIPGLDSEKSLASYLFSLVGNWRFFKLNFQKYLRLVFRCPNIMQKLDLTYR